MQGRHKVTEWNWYIQHIFDYGGNQFGKGIFVGIINLKLHTWKRKEFKYQYYTWNRQGKAFF